MRIPRTPRLARTLYLLDASYTCGFVLTNVAFSLINANLAETVKSAEPITSVAMGMWLLHERHRFASVGII